MAFLADLGNLQNNLITYLQTVAYIQRSQINTPGYNIFCKSSILESRQSLFDAINRLPGKQGNLPVPFSGMGIAFQTPIFTKCNLIQLFLDNSFFMTQTDCLNMCHYKPPLKQKSIYSLAGIYSSTRLDDNITIRVYD